MNTKNKERAEIPAVVLHIQPNANFLIDANSSTAIEGGGARAFRHNADSPVLNQLVVFRVRDPNQQVDIVFLIRPYSHYAAHEGQVGGGAAGVLEARSDKGLEWLLEERCGKSCRVQLRRKLEVDR